jgi:hypothetical protein
MLGPCLIAPRMGIACTASLLCPVSDAIWTVTAGFEGLERFL